MINYTEERLELFNYFLESIVHHFNFLEKMHYKHCALDDGHILYSSPDVDVDIYYERISFEMYLVVTLRKLDISCTIDDILEFNGDLKSKRQYKAVTKREIIEKCVEEMTTILEKYGMDLLVGDAESFRNIRKKGDEERENILLKEKLIEAEKQAIHAWENEDYLTVIGVYNTISKYLTASQKKRLEICINRTK